MEKAIPNKSSQPSVRTNNQSRAGESSSSTSSSNNIVNRATASASGWLQRQVDKFEERRVVADHLRAQTSKVDHALARGNDEVAVVLLDDMHRIAQDTKVNLVANVGKPFHVPLMAKAALTGANRTMEKLVDLGLADFYLPAVVGALIGARNHQWTPEAFAACWDYQSWTVGEAYLFHNVNGQHAQRAIMRTLLDTNDPSFIKHVARDKLLLLAKEASILGRSDLALALVKEGYRVADNLEASEDLPPPYEPPTLDNDRAA